MEKQCAVCNILWPFITQVCFSSQRLEVQSSVRRDASGTNLSYDSMFEVRGQRTVTCPNIFSLLNYFQYSVLKIKYLCYLSSKYLPLFLSCSRGLL
jgi:hypothetical protein